MSQEQVASANTAENQTLEGSPPLEKLPTRFEIELEFIQSLANIPYLTYTLTQPSSPGGPPRWRDPAFIEYLKYLQYWMHPPYCQCVVYPNSLAVLQLLLELMERGTSMDPSAPDSIPRLLHSRGHILSEQMTERWAKTD
ncbi:hypothetical protein TBLA_0F02490 [Henningerozyma blattae CBS 6284]|uniref:Mediator of RNA polymerase II transcription subunit 31 n=1 Tax=Henningerozyma blattae (strain ATCC 34711 / CBS 6284 / DSM 70876 / NBRC 10599 / NRRL Y-10934 / UCD 77-7) TaxID=1071380 RepID=I2H5Y7_HENB6|nr:hypothetical protein TBLA_0F02490 [Tetrapisispora blattae CBS 6284]CCH61789.1 hypothetical protein TBLA_0F02490 [Tetrapisispora blattae CBS 6284]